MLKISKKSRTYKYIDRYGLSIESIINIDLRKTHMQYFIHDEMDKLLTIDGIIDRKMLNTPHYKLASLYYDKGRSWFDKNYKSTQYFKFVNDVLGKKKYSFVRKFNLFDSIKLGYLKKGFEDDYIVVLKEPLIVSRYCFKDPSLKSLEIFMGHHRVAALMALKIYNVKVIMAKDVYQGSCDFNGKLSNNYKKILNNGSEKK